jgi:hypothetical protein
MKKNNTFFDLDTKKTEKFAVLTQDEMIKIKGGGKESPEPPVAK